jgi:L-ascorbate metabolism protein UlaG (beta-lactamase superfamily)
VFCLLFSLPLTAWPDGQLAGTATYIANEGLMVERGEYRILFDPLFRYPSDYYQRVPPETEEQIISGTGIFTGIDAVFISHYHADHFSPAMILRLLREQSGVRLFAPGQAVSAMQRIAGEMDEASFERVKRIDLAYGEEPREFALDGLLIEVVMIPHSGWPGMHQQVENLSYRVTLDGETTVVHMGDADPRESHFQPHGEFWAARDTDTAFPPYWFFLSDSGRNLLRQYIRPSHSVGMHIPADPKNREAELAEFDIFMRPGETRKVD